MRVYGVDVPIKRQPQMSTVVVYIYENVVNKEGCGVRPTSAKRKHSEIEGASGGVDFELQRRLRVGEYEEVAAGDQSTIFGGRQMLTASTDGVSGGIPSCEYNEHTEL